MMPAERRETVAFRWPAGATVPEAARDSPYVIRVARDRSRFELVQAAGGWLVTDEQWDRLTADLIPGSMLFVESGGEPVATACAVARADGWSELSWVAVGVEHRGLRLGRLVCSALLQRLLSAGHTKIFGSTQDERTAALRTYLALGFHPVYREEKVGRWIAICERTGHPYTPRSWGWPTRQR
jgi:GNAT superfamily N-acetyltransferase